MKRRVKVFEPYVATVEDLKRVELLASSDCPRRYCWWWQSLAFDWEVSIGEGCRFLSSEKPKGWLEANTPCSRMTSEGKVDHFEPREPALREDGFPLLRFAPQDEPD